MAEEKLTQEQIDALIKAAAGGGDDNAAETSSPKESSSTEPANDRKKRNVFFSEKKHKPYDFKNPKILSKEQMRTITLVHENYAKHLSSYFSGILRTDCSLTLAATIEESRYYEYSNFLNETVMMNVLEIKPIEGNVLMEINRETCYTIIDRLLGGTGSSIVVQDDFSDIELKLLEKFTVDILKFFKEAWSSVIEVEPRLDRVETNARLTQLMPIDEFIAVVMMTVRIMDHVGSMSICLPCVSLESVLTTAANTMFTSKKRNADDYEESKRAIFDNLRDSKIDIRGILGNTTLTLQELLHLQVGDVIQLDKPIESPVTLKIGPKDWFLGEVGTNRNKMAVKIKSVLEV